MPDDRIIETLVEAACAQAPDVVVVGNLHGAKWPLSLMPALQAAGLRVVAFMHDCYLMSGRCAYPGECRLYETGCNETCPTAHEYPVLEPVKIPAAWRLRREILCGPRGVPLATNSAWTLRTARSALPGLRHGAVLYYGLDERLFREIDRGLARRILGIPEDAFVVLAGAVSLADARKGGRILYDAIRALSREAVFLLFGLGIPEIPNVVPFGFVRDFRKMPVLYSAADVFLGTSLEEAFGQTFCEAAACGRPSVAFRVGGIPEVARHDVNARLLAEPSTEGVVEELRRLKADPELRAELGRAGRKMVEEEFTLLRQGERWVQFLDSLPA
jgi:glycosyltransferase involved in cell wall biosynthesis